jgi:hypothetical protein
MAGISPFSSQFPSRADGVFISFKEFCHQQRCQQVLYAELLPVFPSDWREDIRRWLEHENTPPRERKVFLAVAERTMLNLLRTFANLPQRRVWAVDTEYLTLSSTRAVVAHALGKTLDDSTLLSDGTAHRLWQELGERRLWEAPIVRSVRSIDARDIGEESSDDEPSVSHITATDDESTKSSGLRVRHKSSGSSQHPGGSRDLSAEQKAAGEPGVPVDRALPQWAKDTLFGTVVERSGGHAVRLLAAAFSFVFATDFPSHPPRLYLRTLPLGWPCCSSWSSCRSRHGSQSESCAARYPVTIRAPHWANTSAPRREMVCDANGGATRAMR